MFATASAAASAAAASAAASTTENARPMTNEELVAHQLDLHRRIQQQMQLQMEMSMQLGQRQSLTASIAKVEPDLGDNVFDMLDDLIMVSPTERASLSKNTIEVDNDPTAGRDSLADIMESLDMDLDAFELGPIGLSSSSSSNSSSASRENGSDSRYGDASMLDEGRDSFDDADLDLDDDFDFDDPTSDIVDHGIDDDDGDDELIADSPFRVSRDPNEHAVGDVTGGGRGRLSSTDMLASMASSMTSMSQNTVGNLCTLIWEGGLLGLRLRMSQSRLLPAVSKLTGRSSIYGIHLIDVGDLLLEIGGRSTREMEFIEAVDYLKEVQKPCKLVFRRVHSDPMAVKPIQPPVKSALALKLSQKFDELTAAEEDKAPSAPLVKLDEKYEIKWLDGPLGISLIASKDAPYPLVTRITGKNRSPQVQDVQPGHYLVQIGTYNTADGNFNTAIKYLQKVSKPVSLYFCPSNKKASTRPDTALDEYEQVWEKKQPLCFTVRPDEKGRMVVADVGSAKSVKLKPKGPPGSATTVSSGDLIMWINDDETKEFSFHEALLKLRTAKRPLVIRFKKAPPEQLHAEMRAPPPLPASMATTTTSSTTATTTTTTATTSSGPPPAPHHAPPLPLASSDASPTTTAVKAPGRFNPLKKIAALGSYAKENSINVLNQRHHDNAKKTSSSSPDVPVNKKAILSSGSTSASGSGTAETESRNDAHQHQHSHHHHQSMPAKAAATIHHATTSSTSSSSNSTNNSASNSTNSNSSRSHHPSSEQPTSHHHHSTHHQQHHHASDHDHSTSNDPRRATETSGTTSTPTPHPPVTSSSSSSKLLSMDLLAGLRKPLVNKSASDPNLLAKAAAPNGSELHSHHHNQQHHHTRLARNSSGRQADSASSNGNHTPSTTPSSSPPTSSSSSSSASPASKPAERPDEYEVVWPEGTALGLTLRVHPTTRFPVVARVTGTSNLKNIEHVTPGDVLFRANGALIVPQPKFKQTLENLSRLPKPAVLRFRRGTPATAASPLASGAGRMASSSSTEDGAASSDRGLPRGPSSLKDHEYELIWRENSNLGLVFSSDGDAPRVSKVDPDSGGPNVNVVSVSDTLTCIGPMDISGSSFHASMATLRAVKRPVVLRFTRSVP